MDLRSELGKEYRETFFFQASHPILTRPPQRRTADKDSYKFVPLLPTALAVIIYNINLIKVSIEIDEFLYGSVQNQFLSMATSVPLV